MIKKAIAWLKAMLQYLCSLVYDTFIVHPVTKVIYQQEAARQNEEFEGKPFSLLDIGTGTGLPLKEFMKVSTASRVLAIDINQSYVKTAKKRFENDERVEVKYMNFMELEGIFEEKFDVVYFGFSFMLMPDKEEALRRAAKLMKPNGKILLFLTLYDKPNKFVELVKPKMKFVTSIDFGRTMYKREMPQIFERASIKEVSCQRLQSKNHILLNVFKIYRYELTPLPI